MQTRRLNSRAQFQAVLECRALARTAHFAIHRLEMTEAHTAKVSVCGAMPPLFSGAGVWLGAMVPKRWARRAVTRNLIKRLIYSQTQGLSVARQAAAYVVRLRSTVNPEHFRSASSMALRTTIRSEINALLRAVAATDH